jgi:hypothetical protein
MLQGEVTDAVRFYEEQEQHLLARLAGPKPAADSKASGVRQRLKWTLQNVQRQLEAMKAARAVIVTHAEPCAMDAVDVDTSVLSEAASDDDEKADNAPCECEPEDVDSALAAESPHKFSSDDVSDDSGEGF